VRATDINQSVLMTIHRVRGKEAAFVLQIVLQ
jgi:hypothetical protein